MAHSCKDEDPPEFAAASRIADLGETAKSAAMIPVRLPRDTACYIGDLAGGLASMARGVKLDLLAYLLDLVRLEAARAAGRISETEG